MSSTEVGSETAIETPGARRLDMKLEVVVIPVADVDRAKAFYAGLGWRLDADFAAGDDWRVIQFTPPGSQCSVIFGTNVTAAAPGSAQGLYLIVSDIEAARNELLASRRRGRRGIPRRRRGAHGHGRALFIRPAPGRRARSRRAQLRLVRLVQRSRRQRLAVPGDHHPIARARRCRRHDIRLGGRPRRALRRAGAAHGEHEKRVGGDHSKTWPDWYAEYMVSEQAGKPLPS